MIYTKEELEKILENDFLLNPKAFSRGRTNDDVVDSMCICFALDREWTELFAKWVDNYYGDDLPADEEARILEHYNRVNKWILNKEKHGYKRGDNGVHAIMVYAINY